MNIPPTKYTSRMVELPQQVTVVVPIYYCTESLYLPIDSCLGAVRSLYPHYELLALDDGSPLICPPHWKVERSESNQGFTQTVNQGLERGFSHGADVVIVLNDDITVQEHQLDRFVTLKDQTIAAPSDTAASGDDRFGACWGITRTAWKVLGPLNPVYRHFYSDLDYYERAKKAGISLLKWDDIMLNHPESSTFNLLAKDELLAADKQVWDNLHTGV